MNRDARISGTLSRITGAWSPESPSKAAGCPQRAAKAVLVLFLAVMLTSCTTVRDMTQTVVPDWPKPTQTPHVHLDRLKSVFVALPADAETPSARYIGSGQSVARAVVEAFAGRGITVELADKRLTNDEAVAFAAQTNAGYVVLPLITHWEQRNYWFGLPSRLALWVTVIETATGRVVMAEPVKSHSIDLISFTVESPEALLERPLSRYVSTLY